MKNLVNRTSLIPQPLLSPEKREKESAPLPFQGRGWGLGFGWGLGLRRLGLNSTWLLLARGLVQLQVLVLTVLVARRLGEAGFGQYTLIASLIVLGNVFTTFGTDTLLIRQVAQSRRADSPQLSAALILQVVFSLLFVAGIWLWTAVTPQKSQEFANALRLYSLSLFPLAFFSVYTAALRGFERMDLYLAASLATAVTQLLFVWWALRLGGGLVPLMAVLLAVQVFSMAFSYWLCKAGLPAFSLRLRVPVRLLAQILRAAWPLALLSVLGVAYLRLGVFSLSILGTDVQVGLYSAASRVVDALKLGHIAVLGALLPALSALQVGPGIAGSDTGGASRLFTRSVWGLLVLGLAGALGATLFAHQVVTLLYGSRYLPAEPALRILAWLLVPYSLSAALTVGMISQGKERLVTAVLAASLGSGVLLNLVWVPLWGLSGACLAALAAECVQAGALGFFYWRKNA